MNHGDGKNGKRQRRVKEETGKKWFTSRKQENRERCC
jgi:hypothetical protein